MKTPDAIKKGLECCVNGYKCNKCCPYNRGKITKCTSDLSRDALAYIRRLEAQLVNQATEYSQALKITTEQRDAAVADLKDALDRGDAASFCEFCKHNDDWGQMRTSLQSVFGRNRMGMARAAEGGNLTVLGDTAQTAVLEWIRRNNDVSCCMADLAADCVLCQRQSGGWVYRGGADGRGEGIKGGR